MATVPFIHKSFQVSERQRIHFRAAFNMFNHSQFGLPGNTVDAPGGARITGTAHDPRQVQFALKWEF